MKVKNPLLDFNILKEKIYVDINVVRTVDFGFLWCLISLIFWGNEFRRKVVEQGQEFNK